MRHEGTGTSPASLVSVSLRMSSPWAPAMLITGHWSLVTGHWSGQPPMSPGVAVTLTRGLTSVRSVLRTQTLRGRWWMEVRASPTASFSLHTRDMREKNESLKMFSSKYCVTSSLKLENYSRARKRERGSPTSSWYFHLLFSSAFSSLR